MPELNFINGLNSLFEEITGKKPKELEGSNAIFEDLGYLITDDTLNQVRRISNELSFLLTEDHAPLPIYESSESLFVIWLISKHRESIIHNWPLDHKILSHLACEMGVSLDT